MTRIGIFTLLALVARTVTASSSCVEGTATRYATAPTNVGACGYGDLYSTSNPLAPSPQTMFTAVSTPLWIEGVDCDEQCSAKCGVCYAVTSGASSVVVSTTDLCPDTQTPCPRNGPVNFDMSNESFELLAPPSAGGIPVEWIEVPCPVNGNVGLWLNSGADAGYFEIMAFNHKHGVQFLEVAEDHDTVWSQLDRAWGAYFHGTASQNGPLNVRVTDKYGNVAVGRIPDIAAYAQQAVYCDTQFPAGSSSDVCDAPPSIARIYEEGTLYGHWSDWSGRVPTSGITDPFSIPAWSLVQFGRNDGINLTHTGITTLQFSVLAVSPSTITTLQVSVRGGTEVAVSVPAFTTAGWSVVTLELVGDLGASLTGFGDSDHTIWLENFGASTIELQLDDVYLSPIPGTVAPTPWVHSPTPFHSQAPTFAPTPVPSVDGSYELDGDLVLYRTGVLKNGWQDWSGRLPTSGETTSITLEGWTFIQLAAYPPVTSTFSSLRLRMRVLASTYGDMTVRWKSEERVQLPTLTTGWQEIDILMEDLSAPATLGSVDTPLEIENRADGSVTIEIAYIALTSVSAYSWFVLPAGVRVRSNGDFIVANNNVCALLYLSAANDPTLSDDYSLTWNDTTLLSVRASDHSLLACGNAEMDICRRVNALVPSDGVPACVTIGDCPFEISIDESRVLTITNEGDVIACGDRSLSRTLASSGL